MSASIEAAAAGREEAEETARAERAFLLVLAAVIALEGTALAWFLGWHRAGARPCGASGHGAKCGHDGAPN